MVKTALVTDDTDLRRVEGVCGRCGCAREEILDTKDVIPKKTMYENNPCPECKSMEVRSTEQDIVDYMDLLASKTGSSLEVISGKAEHGIMLASLGKAGALLRYNPGHAK